MSAELILVAPQVTTGAQDPCGSPSLILFFLHQHQHTHTHMHTHTHTHPHTHMHTQGSRANSVVWPRWCPRAGPFSASPVGPKCVPMAPQLVLLSTWTRNWCAAPRPPGKWSGGSLASTGPAPQYWFNEPIIAMSPVCCLCNGAAYSIWQFSPARMPLMHSCHRPLPRTRPY